MLLLNNIYKLHSSIAKFVESYAEKLIKEYGDKLVSVSIYGSAVSSDFNPKKSDINVLLVFNSIGVSGLKKYTANFKKFSKKINPMVFTKEYIQSSQDVYPIEFLEMKDRYLTICGEDVLAGLNVDKKYLRLECEQQLKGSLIKLRHGFLRRGRGGDVERLLNESINTIITIFRNLVRLKSEEVLVEKEKIIDKTAQLYEVDKGVFISVLRNKNGISKICKYEFEGFFEKYMNELERLIAKVDAL